MPHENVPAGLLHWLLALSGGFVTTVAGWFVGRFFSLERRVTTLALLAAASEERHLASIGRLEHIEKGMVRLEQKMDRLIERQSRQDGDRC